MVTASILRRALELQRLAAMLRSRPDCDVEDLSDAMAAEEAAAQLLRDFKTITTLRNKRRMRVGYGAMPHPRHSWWRHLLKLRGAEWDGAWIRFAGVSRELYDELVAVASQHPDFKARPEDEKKVGRPMVIGSQDAIGLALRYMIGMCETVGLMSAFFASSECVNKALDHGLELLLWALQRHPDAYVRWPTKEEQQVYCTVIKEHGSDALPDDLCSKRVFGWVDGFAVPITKPSDKEAARMWYAAKHQRCVASNVFAFTPQGTIMWFRVNVPGSINDTDACRPLTAKILDEQRTIAHGVVMGDVAFKGEVSGASEAYLTPATVHKCTATTTVGDALALGYWVLGKRQSVEVRMHENHSILSRTHTSTLLPYVHLLLLPSSAPPQWGIANFKRTFRRLATGLFADEARRERVLLIAVHLHQLRVRHGARTQLGTVYWMSSRVGKDAADERAQHEAAAEQAAAEAARAAAEALAVAGSFSFDDEGDAAFSEVLLHAVAAAQAADDAAAAAGADLADSDDEDDGFRRRRKGARRESVSAAARRVRRRRGSAAAGAGFDADTEE
jgi:hypothetical protein